MRPPRARATVAAVAAAVAVSLAGVATSVWAAATSAGSVFDSVLSGAVVVSFAVVGAVVAAARPTNPVGWLMLTGATCWSLGQAGCDLAYLGIVARPGSVPAVALCAVGGSALRAIGWYVLTIAVPMAFPDGRLAGRRWRILPWLLGVLMVATVLDPLTDPQAGLTNLEHSGWQSPVPTADWHWLSGLAFVVSVPGSFLLTLAVVAQLVVRWRRGDALVRQQLLMLAAAATVTLLAIPVAFGTGVSWAFSAAALPLPFAIGFAVLARGLYDLRTAVNRTLLWVTLSSVVAAAYAVVVAGVGAQLHVRGASWLPWVAAGVIAVTFAPLRDGLQRAVNRLTFGRWDEPYDVLAALGQRLEGSADVERLLGDVVAELAGLGLHDVSIADAAGHVLAGGGEGGVTVPLSAYGEPVGTLRYRLPAAPLRHRDERLLDDLAGHLGGVLHAHRLTADLQRARESLVLAREEERRRLRRDLHDGLGPALAGHLLRLDVLAGRVPPGSAARDDVEALRRELRTTVLEVRRVVEGLRPPALDELGLAGALAQAVERLTAGTGIAARLDVADLPELSAAVEVAAYRIVTEAVTNAVRHSGAAHCSVAVTVAGRRLCVRVSDDGRGLSGTEGTGHGLQTMRERAEELRGRLRIRGGGGTTVVAELPLPAGHGTRRPALVAR